MNIPRAAKVPSEWDLRWLVFTDDGKPTTILLASPRTPAEIIQLKQKLSLPNENQRRSAWIEYYLAEGKFDQAKAIGWVQPASAPIVKQHKAQQPTVKNPTNHTSQNRKQNSRKLPPDRPDFLSYIIASFLYWCFAYPMGIFFLEGIITPNHLILGNILLVVMLWTGLFDYVFFGYNIYRRTDPVFVPGLDFNSSNRALIPAMPPLQSSYFSRGYSPATPPFQPNLQLPNQNFANKIGTYRCISGHVQHATHWGGPRKCSICGKPMQWIP